MPAPVSLRALLTRSIDYAGMFPPCSLDLERAMTNQAQYVRSPESWMLSGLVLSIEQFGAVKEFLPQFDPSHTLRISALGPKTASASAFSDALVSIIETIRSLSAYDVDLVSISQLEMFLPEGVDLALLDDARSIIGDLPVFWETEAARAEQVITLLAEHNSNASKPSFRLQRKSQKRWSRRLRIKFPSNSPQVFIIPSGCIAMKCKPRCTAFSTSLGRLFWPQNTNGMRPKRPRCSMTKTQIHFRLANIFLPGAIGKSISNA